MIARTQLCLTLLAGASPTLAQGGETIVVTGRGLGQTRSDGAYAIVEIDRDRLAASPSNRLEDLLRDVPGFQQFRRSDARSANPTSQGATLRALGGNASSRALLILDGVPQSDPFGGWIAWPAYDPRRLGRARITRGGGSGIHGPGALAGTIELESAAPDEIEGLRASLAYGSRESLDAFAGAGVSLGSGFLSFSGSFARGNGFAPVLASQRGAADRRAPYRQASFAVRAVTPLAPALELQANAAAFTDRRERGTASSAIAADGADASLRLVGSGGLPFAALAYLQVRDFATSFAAVSDDRGTANRVLDQYAVPSTGVGARLEFRPPAGAIELRLGADGRLTEGRTQELFQFVAGVPARGRVAGGQSLTLGAFAELSWGSGSWLFNAGARIDHWRIGEGRLHERLLASGATLTDTSFPNRAGWEPTGRAGLTWRASPQLGLRAAIYRGWRLPTLNELYRPFRIGADATAANAELSPERLRGIEAGLDWRPTPAFRLGATIFVNRLDDAIANISLGEGPGAFPGVGFVPAGGQFRRRGNVDAVLSRGVELDARLNFGRWRLSAGYSFADAELRASAAAAPLDGLRPAQTPRHSASATLAWNGPRGATAAVTARYVGSQYEDDLNRQLIPDALTFDAVALVPVAYGLALEARAENVTNSRVVAGISGAGIIERATPRTLWLGLRWRG